MTLFSGLPCLRTKSKQCVQGQAVVKRRGMQGVPVIGAARWVDLETRAVDSNRGISELCRPACKDLHAHSTPADVPRWLDSRDEGRRRDECLSRKIQFCAGNSSGCPLWAILFACWMLPDNMTCMGPRVRQKKRTFTVRPRIRRGGHT